MKQFLSITGCGLVVFVAVAMIQEWQVFAPLFGQSVEVELRAVDDVTRSAAEVAIGSFLTLEQHLYRSAGDERFAERLPAASSVVEALVGDIIYLRHNGRYQDPVLEHFEIVEVRARGSQSIEIETVERWQIRVRFLKDGVDSEPPHQVEVRGFYAMRDLGAGFEVVARRLERLPSIGGDATETDGDS